jgi:hypothetical protein
MEARVGDDHGLDLGIEKLGIEKLGNLVIPEICNLVIG